MREVARAGTAAHGGVVAASGTASARDDALSTPASRKRRSTYLMPLAIFALLAVFLGIGLTLDPRLVPSPLVGKPVPEFRLAPVQGRALGLATEDLRGEVSVVNVFASWCLACRDEHPLWMELARQRTLPIHGLNYKDAPDDAQRWLSQLGDPYSRTGADRDGRVAIDWGVYGVPETFVVDKNGVIRDKIIGAITRKSVDERLLPLVRRLQAE
jgi:cytochrome c biogenesis protein CcmG/thiol:disulfide interchange protein DsbE